MQELVGFGHFGLAFGAGERFNRVWGTAIVTVIDITFARGHVDRCKQWVFRCPPLVDAPVHKRLP
jgi:hypothetical protein